MTRRPLFSLLAAVTVAIWISVLIVPWSPRDYETERDRIVDLEGIVDGIEPDLEGDQVVWKMTLSNLSQASYESQGSHNVQSGYGGKGNYGSQGGNGGQDSYRSQDSHVSQDSQGSRNGNRVPNGHGAKVLCVLESQPAVESRSAVESRATGESRSALESHPVAKSRSALENQSAVKSQLLIEPGARVRVRGRLSPFRRARNEGAFDLCRYYHILRLEYSLRDVKILAVSKQADHLAAGLYRLKRALSVTIDRIFSAENAPLIKAILLGEKGFLTDETKELYQGAGIIHILSISGMHMSLVGMGFLALLDKVRIPLFHISVLLRGDRSILIRRDRAILLRGDRSALLRGEGRDSRKNKENRKNRKNRENSGRRGRMQSAGQPREDSGTVPGSYLTNIVTWKKIPFPLRAVAAFAVIFLYGKMVGMGTSVFRAMVMLSLFIVSKVIGRTYDLLTAAGIACVLLLLDQPLYLLHTGFLFSFAAVMSIGILLPAIPGKFLKVFAIPLGTLPVYLWTNGTFPLYSLLLNMVVIPLMTVVMASGGTALLLGSLAPAAAAVCRGTAFSGISSAVSSIVSGAAGIAGFPAELVLNLYRFLSETSGRLPLHEIVPGRPAPARIILYYIMLSAFSMVSVCLQMPHVRRRIEGPGDPGRKLTIPVIVKKICSFARARDNRERRRLACICAAVWMAGCAAVITFHVPPAFEMVFLYVGQGDGIYISSGGRHFLVDGGSSSEKELAKYTLIPFLHCRGVSRLDGVILTHDDIDHCSGLLEFLEAAQAGSPGIGLRAIYLPDIDPKARGTHFLRIEELAEKQKIPVLYISRGQRIRSGKLTLACLHPAKGAFYEDANASSTTLCLRYGAFSALLTGDLEGEGEKDLLDYLRTRAAVPADFETSFVSRNNSRDDSQNNSRDDPQNNSWDIFQHESQNDSRDNLQNESQDDTRNDFRSDLQNASLTNPQNDPRNSSCLLRTSLLKVAHHGSKNATSVEFLESIHTDFAVISAGVNNMYGHPNSELLQRLKDAGISYDRTDQSGMITVGIKKGGLYARDFAER